MTRFDVLRERLLQDGVISELVQGRTYNQTAPTQVKNTITNVFYDTPYPYIVLNQIGSQSAGISDPDTRDYFYAIECYEKNGQEHCETIAKHVRNAMNNDRARNENHPETILEYAILMTEPSYTTTSDADRIYQNDVNVRIRFKETI